MTLIVQPLTKKPQDRTAIYYNPLILIMLLWSGGLGFYIILRDWQQMADAPYMRLLGLLAMIAAVCICFYYGANILRLFKPAIILDENGITVQTSLRKKDDYFTAWQDVLSIHQVATNNENYLELVVRRRYMLHQLFGWQQSVHVENLTYDFYDFDFFLGFFSNEAPMTKKMQAYYQNYRFTEPHGDIRKWYDPPPGLWDE